VRRVGGQQRQQPISVVCCACVVPGCVSPSQPPAHLIPATRRCRRLAPPLCTTSPLL
jgi:hypothetical protein